MAVAHKLSEIYTSTIKGKSVFSPENVRLYGTWLEPDELVNTLNLER